MKRSLRALGIAGGLLAAGAAHADGVLKVAAVNAPLAWFAQTIAGDAAVASVPAPEGEDPAHWAPTADEVAAVQKADIILLNGAGYAKWTELATLPRSRTIDTTRAVRDRFIPVGGDVHSHGEAGAHSHGAVAATTWLDFAIAAEQAKAVAAALTRKKPESEEEFGARLAEIEADLTALDAEAKRIGALAQGVKVIGSHPVYQYLGRAAGLDLAEMHWEPHETPPAEQWTAFDALRGDVPAVMLWEGAPTAETAAALKERGVPVAVFAIGAARGSGDFIEVMRAGLAAFEAALRRL